MPVFKAIRYGNKKRIPLQGGSRPYESMKDYVEGLPEADELLELLERPDLLVKRLKELGYRIDEASGGRVGFKSGTKPNGSKPGDNSGFDPLYGGEGDNLLIFPRNRIQNWWEDDDEAKEGIVSHLAQMKVKPNYKKQLLGAQLSYDGIMELLALLQNAGFFSKGGRVSPGGLAYLLGEK